MTPTLLLTACLLSLTAGSFDDDQAKLSANLKEKLAKAFIKKGSWELDYDRAKAKATGENKLLFVYFTRTFAP